MITEDVPFIKHVVDYIDASILTLRPAPRPATQLGLEKMASLPGAGSAAPCRRALGRGLVQV